MSRPKPLKFNPFTKAQEPPKEPAPCTVTFAHNTVDQRVALLFNGPVTALYFSVAEAEDVAKNLLATAKLARGGKV